MEKAMNEGIGCSLVSLVALLSVLIILNWLIVLHFQSNLRYLFLCFLCEVMQVKTIFQRSCTDEKVCDHKPSKGVETNSTTSSDQVPSIHAAEISYTRENVVDGKKNLCLGELGLVMEKLETLSEGEGGSKEIANLFEEVPSMEEVKEAFRVFDENEDGFIDAGEVKKVLSVLGFVEASEVECQRMIKSFDDDGDGRIDFDEFVKLMENSFC
ncbi:unnamed protein product [Malus baccata var. baccata]